MNSNPYPNIIRTIVLLCIFLLVASSPVSAQKVAQSDTLFVTDLVLTTNVVNREPVDTVQAFTTEDQRVFCHARFQNTYDLKKIEFQWFFNGEKYYTMGAKISRSPNWRTFSSVTPRPGKWMVRIVDSKGKVLKEKSFQVEQPD